MMACLMAGCFLLIPYVIRNQHQLNWENIEKISQFQLIRETDENRWEAFSEICKSQFGFNPDNDGIILGAERLANHEGPGFGVKILNKPVPPAFKELVEIAVEKGASGVLMPVNCRRQLADLSDDIAIKVNIQFYADARDALLKAMME